MATRKTKIDIAIDKVSDRLDTVNNKIATLIHEAGVLETTLRWMVEIKEHKPVRTPDSKVIIKE